MSHKKISIAVDGYVSAGKGATAQGVASQLGYVYVDTGAMYRGITSYLLEKAIFPTQQTKVQQALKSCDFVMELKNNSTHIHINGQDFTPHLRTMRVNEHVALYAALPFVREYLREKQIAIGKKGGVVMDGRDIGTHIIPQAELKVFMIGSVEVRARRRQKQLQEKEKTVVPLQDIIDNIHQRDKQDYTGPNPTSAQAQDARILDTTDITLAQQIDTVVQWAREYIN